MGERLQSAIARLREEFARYPKVPIDVCPCGCVSPAYVDLLRTKPLLELTGADLSNYAFRALGTMDGVPAWKHFLPRIFELCVTDADMFPEVSLTKLSKAGWRSWPRSEQQAIEEFFRAWWLGTLDQSADAFESDPAPDAILGSIPLVGIEVRPYVDELAQLPVHLWQWLSPKETGIRRRKSLGLSFPEASAALMTALGRLEPDAIGDSPASGLLRWIKNSEFGRQR